MRAPAMLVVVRRMWLVRRPNMPLAHALMWCRCRRRRWRQVRRWAWLGVLVLLARTMCGVAARRSATRWVMVLARRRV